MTTAMRLTFRFQDHDLKGFDEKEFFCHYRGVSRGGFCWHVGTLHAVFIHLFFHSARCLAIIIFIQQRLPSLAAHTHSVRCLLLFHSAIDSFAYCDRGAIIYMIALPPPVSRFFPRA